MELFGSTAFKQERKRRKMLQPDEPKEPETYFATRILTEDPEVESLPKQPMPVPWLITLLALFMGIFHTLSKQQKEIQTLKAKISTLTIEKLKDTVYTEKLLKIDQDVVFYTGLESKNVFNKLYSFISPYVNRRWTGVVSMSKGVCKFKSKLRFGLARKLSSKSEFFLMLAKLKLGLPNKDLAKRFKISDALCSRIFFAWLRATSALLKSMVFMPVEEALIATKPERFKSVVGLHSIMDCTEIFIETPKDLYLQSASWSDYKHHNTLKILVACTPNSFINYVSPSYLGRISNKALRVDCGYLICYQCKVLLWLTKALI